MGSTSGEISISISKEDVYEFSPTKPKPIAFIICNKKFENMNDVPCFQRDLDRIQPYLQNLGFQVLIKINRTASEMDSDINDVRDQINNKHNEQQVFVCIIMSHGSQVSVNRHEMNDDYEYEIELDGESCVYGTDGLNGRDADNGKLLVIRQIVRKFNNEQCEHFHGKPKLFFFISCRGDTIDLGTYPEHDGLEPTWSDIFICYATIPGYVSWVWPPTGSYLGQAIADELEDCENRELSHIIARAAEKVHNEIIKFENENGEEVDAKLSISTETRGWRKLFFFKLNHQNRSVRQQIVD